MLFIQMMGVLLWLGLVPFLLGQYFVNNNEYDMQALCKRYVFGLVIMFALFEIITVPFTFYKSSLTMVITVFCVICAFLIIFSFIRNKTSFTLIKEKSSVNRNSFIGYLALVVILFQIIYVVTHMHIDDDDAWYIGTAVTSYFTDTLNLISPYTGDLMEFFPSDYTLSPFPIFYAMIGRLTNIHPAVLAHTIIPVFWIGASYMVYYLISCKLFKRNEIYIAYFMFFLSIFNIFANFSVRSVSTFMLFRIWQGKAMLCSFIVPLCYFIYMLCMEEKDKFRYWSLLMVAVVAGTMVSSMGVFLLSVLLVALAFVFTVWKHNLRILFNTILCIMPCIFQFGIYMLVLR